MTRNHVAGCAVFYGQRCDCTTAATPRLSHWYYCPGCGGEIGYDSVGRQTYTPPSITDYDAAVRDLKAMEENVQALREENARLREAQSMVAAAAMATMRARCREAVEELGIREAGHGHCVSGVSGGPAPTDEDFEQAKKGCHWCLKVNVLDEAVRAIDATCVALDGPDGESGENG